MADPFHDFKRMSPHELRSYVERLSDEYRNVITLEEHFDRQTGLCAVIQKKVGGPETRKEVILNSGVRSEGRAQAKRAETVVEIIEKAHERGYEPKAHGELVQVGPIKQQVRGHSDVHTLDAEGRKVPYDPHSKVNQTGELKVLEHHAEMRLQTWAEANGYEIVAMAPTRGCCRNCQASLKAALGEERFKAVVPESRQTPQAYSEHLEKRLSVAAHPESTHVDSTHLERAPAPGLAAQGHDVLRYGGKMLSHLGNAAIALDAINVAEDVHKKLQAGHTTEAASAVVGFGGRTWGGIEGAAVGAEIGGVAGSVVPGAGTLAGAMAGGLIGGIIGASAGEESARQLFHGLKQLGEPQHQARQEEHALGMYVYEAASAAVGERMDNLLHRNPTATAADIYKELRADPLAAVRSLSIAGERVFRGSFESTAVARELDRQSTAGGAEDRPSAATLIRELLGRERTPDTRAATNERHGVHDRSLPDRND